MALDRSVPRLNVPLYEVHEEPRECPLQFGGGDLVFFLEELFELPESVSHHVEEDERHRVLRHFAHDPGQLLLQKGRRRLRRGLLRLLFNAVEDVEDSAEQFIVQLIDDQDPFQVLHGVVLADGSEVGLAQRKELAHNRERRRCGGALRKGLLCPARDLLRLAVADLARLLR